MAYLRSSAARPLSPAPRDYPPSVADPLRPADRAQVPVRWVSSDLARPAGL